MQATEVRIGKGQQFCVWVTSAFGIGNVKPSFPLGDHKNAVTRAVARVEAVARSEMVVKAGGGDPFAVLLAVSTNTLSRIGGASFV
jgi:hypothetical protein